MSLSTDLISQFVKMTNDKERNRTVETTVYGTTVARDGSIYVKLDGSEILTPVSTTADMNPKGGERVVVMIKNHTAIVTGNISSPSARNEVVREIDGEVKVVKGQIADFEMIIADKASVGQLEAEVAKIEALQAENVVINGKLDANEASIKNLQAEDVTINGKLDANAASIKNLQAEDVTINGKLDANAASIKNLQAEDVTINGKLDANAASIKNLQAEDVTINGKLAASNAKISTLESDVADIDTLIFGSASGTSIHTSFANAVIAQLGNAQIKSAMIDSVSASKITAGDIITNNVKVKSSDGKLLISDETIQISDNTRVRVQIGKDAANDYSINIWDDAGKLMFSKGGITDSAIKEAIIRNDMVKDDANISASKLNIDSLFEEINGSSKTIKSSKVYLDDKKQTLDVSFTAMTNSVETATTTANTAIVNAAQAQSDINNLEVGGRNLLLGTDFKDVSIFKRYFEHSADFGSSSSLEKTDGGLKFTAKTSLEDGVKFPLVFDNCLENNTDYTLSFSYRTNSTRLGILYVLQRTSPHVYIRDGLTLVPSETEWQKFSVTFKSSDINPRTSYALLLPYLANAWVEFKDCSLKLEKGNKATDWTPAPEDVEGAIETITERVTTQGTDISVVQGQISSKVWQQDIETAVDNVKVGGRNLFINSSFSKDRENWDGLRFDITTIDGITCGHIHCELGKVSTAYQSIFDKIKNDDVSQVYTFSADIRADNIVLGSGPTFALYFEGAYNNNGTSTWLGATKVSGTQELYQYNNKGWVRAVWTVRFAHKPTRMIAYVYARDCTGDLYFKNLKLEKGNKATDWTPAPEDVDGAVTSLNTKYSELKQSTDGVAITVGNHTTELSNKASRDEVTAVSNRVTNVEIDLSGFKSTVSSTYTTKEDFNNLEVGGRNLLLGSKNEACNSNYGLSLRTFANPSDIVAGKQYTISFEGRLTDATQTGFYVNVYPSPYSQCGGVIQRQGDDSEYHRYTSTFTMPNNGSFENMGFYSYPAGSYKESAIKNIKLEIGNKATDWTPAPEDVEGEIDSVVNRIAQAETKIDQKADSITLSATKTELLNAIDDVEVGGRNLLLGTKFDDISSLLMWSNLGTLVKTDNGLKFTATTSSPNGVKFPLVFDDCLENATEYTLSFSYRTNSLKLGSIYVLQRTGGNVIVKESLDLVQSETEWQKFSTTFSSSHINPGTGYALLIPYMTNSWIEFKDGSLKLEKGNKATDWTPAPEDVESSVQTLTTKYSELKQTAEGISVIVAGHTTELSNKAGRDEITDAVDNINVGGRNLLKESGVEVTNNEYLVHGYTPSSPLTEGEQYAISICVTPANGLTGLTLYLSGGSSPCVTLRPSGTDKQILTDVFTAAYYPGYTPDHNIYYATANIYRFPNDGTITDNTTIHWIKIEKGNKATDWTPAPEDVDNAIRTVSDRVTSQGSDMSIIQGQISSKVWQQDIETAIDGVVLGGRNLLKDSANVNVDGTAYGITHSKTEDGHLQIVAESSNGNYAAFYCNMRDYAVAEGNLSEGDKYVLSFTMRSPDSAVIPSVYIKSGMGYYDLKGRMSPEWSTVWYSGIWKDENDIDFHLGFSGRPGTYEIKSVKLEKGNKASDWTPAPEDVESEIDSVVNRIAQAETKIDQKADSITLSATKTELLNAIDNVEVGGRNLLINSSFSKDSTGWGSTPDITTIDGVTCGHISCAIDKTMTANQDIFSKIKNDDVSQVYTFSADIRADNIVTNATSSFALYFEGAYNKDGTSTWLGATKVSGTQELYQYNNKGWVRTSWTIRFNHKPTRMRAYIYTRNCTGDLYFKNLKLEKGNKATDWTPAPEDSYTKSETDALIKIESDKISAVVSDVSGLGSRTSTLEQRADGLSLSLDGVRGDVSEASKTATNYLDYTADGGLQVGNKSSGSWVGTRAQIMPDSYNILDEEGNTIAQYGKHIVKLGIGKDENGNRTATIDLCDGLGTISSFVDAAETEYLRIDSDHLRLKGNQSASLYSEYLERDEQGGWYDESYATIETFGGQSIRLSVNGDTKVSGAFNTRIELDADGIRMQASNGAITINNALNVNGKTTIDNEFIVNGAGAINGALMINGIEFNPNKVLWSGEYWMQASQVIDLAEGVSEQTNGIVLVFSDYHDAESNDYHWNLHFVPKYAVAHNGNGGTSFLLTSAGDFEFFASKYLYINDFTIKGHDNNKKIGTGACGISYNNQRFVLRYVIGV